MNRKNKQTREQLGSLVYFFGYLKDDLYINSGKDGCMDSDSMVGRMDRMDKLGKMGNMGIDIVDVDVFFYDVSHNRHNRIHSHHRHRICHIDHG